MNIDIYYAKVVPNPKLEKTPENEFIWLPIDEKSLDYYLVWKGTPQDLKISEDAKDLEICETAFHHFNRHTPAEDERSLSNGDVISINDRAYLCEASGWRQLDDFSIVSNFTDLEN